jgi:lipoprotein NlpD
VPASCPGVADRAGFYTVKKGDTLYSIALDHGQDYKDVAAWNYLENPNLIKVGQQLRVVPPEGAAARWRWPSR